VAINIKSGQAIRPSHSLVGIIFSKDRPLQLEATLASFRLHHRNTVEIKLKVLYAVSSATYQSLYQKLTSEYSDVEFVKQGAFRVDLIDLVRNSNYVLFLVDDNLFVREFHIGTMVEALEDYSDALGFSLRLGRNTTYCYTLDRPQRPPEFETLSAGTLKFSWLNAECDFGYPVELSSSIYRTADLLPLLNEMLYESPNALESELAKQQERFQSTKPFLLCCQQSLVFSAPLNKVQNVFMNRVGQRSDYSPAMLAQAFAEGLRIDVMSFSKLVPLACHQEIELVLLRVNSDNQF